MLTRKEIKEIIVSLRAQNIVILPTDTIYGLSAIISRENEIRINKIKKSPESKRLIVLVSNLNQAKSLVNLTEEIKNNFLSKDPTTQIISQKNNPNKNIAIRMIKRKDLKKIINKSGPIFSTSVNKTGSFYLTQKADLEAFDAQVTKVYWDGELHGKPSKIIDLATNTTLR